MLKMLLAYGVTTIRNPGGATDQSVILKENVTKGKIKGPQIFTAGRLINDPQIPIPFVESKSRQNKRLDKKFACRQQLM